MLSDPQKSKFFLGFLGKTVIYFASTEHYLYVSNKYQNKWRINFSYSKTNKIYMQIWFTNKFINRAQCHIFSHSLQFMGTINTYQKPFSIQLHLLWRIPRLSLVSKLYLTLCFWYLIFSFVLGSDRLIILTLPLWCI